MGASGDRRDRASEYAKARGCDSFEVRLGRAVDYLEERLDGTLGEPSPAGAARAAGWSEWHFMRLFRAASGMAVGEYVRARRLSRAAAALSRSGISVLEAAVEAGYESQAAFSRAFARAFGLSPTEYRRRFALAGTDARSDPLAAVHLPGLIGPFEPRLPFEPPEPRVHVATLPALALLGVGARSRFHAYESFRDLPRIWEDWLKRRRWIEVPALEPDKPIYGLCAPSVESEFAYYICVEPPAATRPPPGWKRIDVPAGRYAISYAEGPQPRAIQGATLAAYAKWLPASGFARGPGWDVETYYGDGTSCELRIPIGRQIPMQATARAGRTR